MKNKAKLSSIGGTNMKSFFMGVLVTLVVGLGIQNHILSKELEKSLSQGKKQNKTQVVKPVIQKKKTAKVKVQKITDEEVVKVASYNHPDSGPKTQGIKNYDPRDPRCPPHMPYYNERWGCIVIPR